MSGRETDQEGDGMTQAQLAKTLRVLRAERGLSLRQAAKLANVDAHTLSFAERGERMPYDTTLARLAKVYGVPVSRLVGDPDIPLVA
jgi:transcriptional regulator with XRE-family HTH domain